MMKQNNSTEQNHQEPAKYCNTIQKIYVAQ